MQFSQNIPYFYRLSKFKYRCFAGFEKEDNIASAEEKGANFFALRHDYFFASSMAMALPIPRLAPVINAYRFIICSFQ